MLTEIIPMPLREIAELVFVSDTFFRNSIGALDLSVPRLVVATDGMIVGLMEAAIFGRVDGALV